MLTLLLSLAAAADLSVAPGPLVSGQTFTVTVDGLRAGEAAMLGVGTRLGNGPCPPELGGACLDLSNPVSLGTGIADDAGRATWTLTAPDLDAGRQVFLQAATLRRGAGVLSEATRVDATWLGVHAERLIRGTTVTLAWTAADALDGAALSVTDGTHTLGSLGTLRGGHTSREMVVPTTLPLGASVHLAADHPTEGTTVSDPVEVGALAGFYWNGQSQQMAWVDLEGNVLTDAGPVGDMASWAWNAKVMPDRDRGTVWIPGLDARHAPKLWEMDTATGTVLTETPLPPVHLLGTQLLPDGDMLGLSWNGNAEVVHRIDPQTGVVTDLSTIDGFYHWAGETAYDPAAGVLWVLGFDTASRGMLWGIDPSTGAEISEVPFDEGHALGLRLDRDGSLLTSWSNGAEQVFARIDPWTGTANVLGTVGDLASWSGQTVLDDVGRRMFIWGNDDAHRAKVYELDADTGALLDERFVDMAHLLGLSLVY